MANLSSADNVQLVRELAHWQQAIRRMKQIDRRASIHAWNSMDSYLGIAIKQRLLEATDALEEDMITLRDQFHAASESEDRVRLRTKLVALRRQFLKTETTIDYFADAINTRSSTELARLLTACDILADRSMRSVLSQLDKKTPRVLTYIDKGLGASILKMGLRLWDGGTINPVAVIKVVFHNLLRPTSIIHEAGHQVAHILNWNDELAESLRTHLSPHSEELAEVWAGWSSEIAADAYAFAHTGYASVASLHDVLSGGANFVYRYVPGDPHPVSFIRVLLGIEWCRGSYGKGHWDRLAQSWLERHQPEQAPSEVRRLIRASLPLLPSIAQRVLNQPMQAFGQQRLTDLVDPTAVHPQTLLAWQLDAGPALFQSRHQINDNPVRLLALSNYLFATTPHQADHILRQQEGWMLRLGANCLPSSPPKITHYRVREIAV